jgi:hypothetical protein
VNEIEEKASWCNFVTYSSFRRVFERLMTFFIIASNKIAISLRIDEESDRDDYVTSRDSKLINDDDNENDDEAQSKKKSTKVVFWFFFFSIDDNTIERQRTTKVVFRFLFSFKRVTNDDDMMTTIFASINNRDDTNTSFVILTQSSFVDVAFFRTSLSEFFNRYSIALLMIFMMSWMN